METVFVVDPDRNRADSIRHLLLQNQIPVKRCLDIQEIWLFMKTTHADVIIAHCGLINSRFTELAVLKDRTHVKLVFYCTEPNQKSAGFVAKLPEDLHQILNSIGPT